VQEAEYAAVTDSFEACPKCEYDGGFHVLLRRTNNTRSSNLELYLKCPECKVAYKVGWLSRLAE
jgi:hypothetical protein